MKLIIATLLAGYAAAFAPIQQQASSSTLSAFESELGVQAPIGFFDPLGLLDQADQDRFDRLRYVEIKHGRISMLAFLGNIITRAGLHLPGSINSDGAAFDSFSNGYAGATEIPLAGLYQITAFIGFLEIFVMKDAANGAEPGEFPGDFRNGLLDFGWDSFSDDAKYQKRAIELNNGRAAMLGILGLMIHEQIGGSLPIVGNM